MVPQWMWLIYTFALGCCVGSFLNVVIYRLPKEKSLIKPGSFCPACNKHIRFYDNIPLLSWLVLGRKCRFCKAPISPRYFIIELLTGLMFVFTYYLFFISPLRNGMPNFLQGGWLLYLITIILLSALIASSAIDLELWIIPLSVCWFITVIGIVVSTIAPLLIDHKIVEGYKLLPYASAKTSALAAGAAVGLCISLILLFTGILKQSYEFENQPDEDSPKAPQNPNHTVENATHADSQIPDQDPNTPKNDSQAPSQSPQSPNHEADRLPTPAPSEVEGSDACPERSRGEPRINHRLEVAKEVLFLLPIVVCSYVAYRLTTDFGPVRSFWIDFSQKPPIAGLLGGIFGYFIGCAIVWATRILGTLAFGREAMGLGDVHLMGGAAACVGAVPVAVAFFIAPFFGLAWAVVQMFFKKSRQIPYGPFLSLGVLVAIIAHDRIWSYLGTLLG